jgi:amino acid transporter
MNESSKISFFSAVLMSMNIMVGAGIFYAVGPMTGSVGAMSFLGWPLIGCLLFPVIWGVAKAAQLFPGEGGFYHYCSSGINPTAGFIAHWGYLLGFISSAASLATVLRAGLAQNAGIALFQEYPVIFNLGAVLLYSCIQFLSIGKISKIQSFATLLKITPILAVIGLILFYFAPDFSFRIQDLGQFSVMIPTVIFAFWGFEACCSIGGYLKGGPQKVSSVILLGFFATMGLYLLFHFGLLQIMGKENLAVHGAIGFPRFLGLTPLWESALQTSILGAILFCWANSILGMSLGNITNIYFLAKKKMIVGDRLLSTVTANDRPTYAILVHGIIIFLLLTFITDTEILFALTNLGVLTAFALTLISVFLAYVKQKNYLQMSIISLAFVSCSVLGYYSWVKIPSIYYTLPLIICMAIGVLQFKIKQAQRLRLEVL